MRESGSFSNARVNTANFTPKFKLSNTHSYLISTLTFTILFFFIKPSLILNSTQLLSLSLFYI
jgi:NADH-ubiquinone oxidoreductase chain 2